MSPQRRSQPWMDIDDAELLRLMSDGVALTEIAMRLGRTRAAIEGRLTRLRAKGRV